MIADGIDGDNLSVPWGARPALDHGRAARVVVDDLRGDEAAGNVTALSVVPSIESNMSAPDGGDDFVGIGNPSERFGFCIVVVEEARRTGRL